MLKPNFLDYNLYNPFFYRHLYLFQCSQLNPTIDFIEKKKNFILLC